MKAQTLRRLRQIFWHPDVPVSTSRHNARQWVRSIRMLGSRWLLAHPINRSNP